MTAGDIAAAAGMPIYTGNEEAHELWIRDNEILDEIATDRTAVRSIPRGGTGGGTAAAARTALGTRSAAEITAEINARRPPGLASGTMKLEAVSGSWYTASKLGVDNDMTVGAGHLFLPSSSPATSGYTVCYINSDGRVSRGASSARFKKWIREVDPLQLGRIFPPLVRYQLRSAKGSPSDNAWHYGHIAETLARAPELEPFVVYEVDADGKPTRTPLSIDFVALLLAQTAQLDARLRAAEDRIAKLEQLVEQLVDEKGTA